MKGSEKEIFFYLLEEASDRLSNRTCNDLTLVATPENVKLIIDANRWANNNPPDYTFYPTTYEDRMGIGKVITQDYLIFDYLVHLMKKELDG